MSLSNSEILLQPISYRRRIITQIWEEYSNYSVEALSTGRAGVYDFAEEECMYFAVIKRVVRFPIMVHDEEGSDPCASSSEDEIDPSQAPVSSADVYNYKAASGAPFRTREETIGIIYLVAGQLPGCVNLGCCILSENRGQGYGTQAVRLLLGWAFEDLGCHRVQVRIADGDAARRSQAGSLLLSLGFIHEGTARRSLFCPSLSQEECSIGMGGEWQDVQTYAMLDTDWVTHKDLPYIPSSLVKVRWDELFRRHDQERSETLAFEERQQSKAQKERAVGKEVKRTTSTETLKIAGSILGDSNVGLEGAPRQSDERRSMLSEVDALRLADTPSPGPEQDEIDDELQAFIDERLSAHQSYPHSQGKNTLTSAHLSFQGHRDPFSYMSSEDARYRSVSPSFAGVTYQSEDEFHSSASSPLLPRSPLMRTGTPSGNESEWETASVPRSPSVLSNDGSTSSWDLFEAWEPPVSSTTHPSVHLPSEDQ